MARIYLLVVIAALLTSLASVSGFFNQHTTKSVNQQIYIDRSNNAAISKLHRSGDVQNNQLTAHVGSDIIGRPEDEDSPQFREYLKSLLKMQANRAKTGFSAPSSGSADAYIAKLNRLKIERNMRIKAGLPDVPLDGSYRPEDYTAALAEAKEPLVSDRILSGDNPMVQSKGKSRGLTAEEVAFTKLAEERVQESLAKEQLQVVDVPDTYKRIMTQSYSRPESSAPDDSFDFIDDILNRKAPKKSSPVTVPAAVAPETQPPKTELTAMPPIERKSAFKDAVMARLQQQQQQQEASLTAPLVAVEAIPASRAQSLEKKLNKEELEIAGEALQALVKHRGGGPFGVGRLQGEEADEMIAKLRDAIKLFESETVSSPSSLPSSVRAAAPQPVQATVQAKSASAPLQEALITSDASVAVAVESVDQLPSMLDLSKSTIAAAQVSFVSDRAMSLNKFLQNPQSLSFNELGALRETLLDCLSAVHVQLTTTNPSGTVAQAAPPTADNVPPMHIPSTSMTNAGPGTSSVSSDGELPLEKELRLALGLLIKHRGGPGFGHGRLQGKELAFMEEKLTSVVKRLQAEAV